MKAPVIYAEWVQVFTAFKNKTDDEAVLKAMQEGKFTWGAGVATRFSEKLVDAVETRITAAQEKFKVSMSRSHGDQDIIQAIIMLRKELKTCVSAVSIPVIPEEQRVQYEKMVRTAADRIQESLETTAKNDRSGKLSSIVRNNKVNAL